MDRREFLISGRGLSELIRLRYLLLGGEELIAVIFPQQLLDYIKDLTDRARILIRRACLDPDDRISEAPEFDRGARETLLTG